VRLAPRIEQALTASGLAVILTVGFYATDFHMARVQAGGGNLWAPSLAWESAIPFSPAWIWVYLLYFPLCFLPVFFDEVLSDLAVFRRTAAGYFLQYGAAFAVFWLLPSRMVRPEPDASGLSGWAVLQVYRADPGFNIFPSLHVANAAFVACLASRLRGRPAGAVLWAACLLIAASTLFVKQHYFCDLPAGLALGALAYRLAFSRALDFIDPAAT
jgi:membrane-associated phospholipid phosphatase